MCIRSAGLESKRGVSECNWKMANHTRIECSIPMRDEAFSETAVHTRM